MVSRTQELVRLLEEDQQESRIMGRAFFQADNTNLVDQQKNIMRKRDQRAKKALQILKEIGDPSISNLGVAGAQAMSILALHASPNVLREVLGAFTKLYQRKAEDTYYQAIPSMTDLLLILEHHKQRFATQWLFDKNKQPFLPSVEDFEHVNERRHLYGIEPLHWPKSLALPASKQPWLKRPLSELVMRNLTKDEYDELLLNR